MQSGVLDKEIADGHWTTMATMQNSFPGFRSYWDSRGYSYTPQFQEFVETEVFTRAPLEYSPEPIGIPTEPSTDVAAITAQLKEIYAVSTGAEETGAMVERHLQFFAEQPTVLPPGQDALVGREAVSDFYRRIFAEVEILENRYSGLSISVHGDLATRQYIGVGTMRVNGHAESQTTENQMTDILIKDQGKWKTLIHSWSAL
jgi:ketosteroid isomerase-like protein